MLAKVDPTFRQAKTPSPTGSMAQPMNLLGAPPGIDVTYFSERAKALLGPDAAFIDAPIPRYQISGATFNALA